MYCLFWVYKGQNGSDTEPRLLPYRCRGRNAKTREERTSSRGREEERKEYWSIRVWFPFGLSGLCGLGSEGRAKRRLEGAEG